MEVAGATSILQWIDDNIVYNSSHAFPITFNTLLTLVPRFMDSDTQWTLGFYYATTSSTGNLQAFKQGQSYIKGILAIGY